MRQPDPYGHSAVAKLPIISQGAEPSDAVQSPLHFAASLAPRRVYIDTFGCQMNLHDSQRMVSLMAAEGYVPTEGPEDADLIILNSCSVRDKAEQKVRSRAGELKRLKKARPEVVLAIGGCVAQQEGQRMLERIPHADIVFGPDHLSRLPELVKEVIDGGGRRNETEFLDRSDFQFPEITDAAPLQTSAFVSVMKGCDKFCAFCIVPFTRGREVSRPAQEVVEEVRRLADRGTREIVLLGQTVNTYGQRKRDDQIPFHELLARVCEVPGVERVRFTSPHPADFTDDQIAAFRDLPQLCPHMHLPVQSGSDRVLKLMRRGYTRAQYLEVVDRLREVAPQVALGTDIIVGFPGETEEDFELTLSLIERVRYHSAYSFAYSERVGTRALDFEGAVPVPERFDRLRRLQAMQDAITKEFLDAMVGTRQTIMVEGPSKTDPTRVTGRTGQNRPVHAPGEFKVGTLLEVEIVEAYKHSALGRALIADGIPVDAAGG
ncbi:MAG: tRNA (N6-isopentenyl adenosine(37)-C2)-methylthiotransferase MiaB [Myxococcota bacterium]